MRSRSQASTYVPFVGTVAFLLSGGAAADTLRCEGRLVAVGMSADEVRTLCREPTEQRSRTVHVAHTTLVRRSRTERRGATGSEQREQEETETIIEPVDVREWAYDLSAGEFVRLVIFEGGRVTQIRSLQRGSWYKDRATRILDNVPPYTPPPRRINQVR